MKVYVIPPEGPAFENEVVDEDESAMGSLAAFQELVEGNVQFLPHPRRSDVALWINDEGKFMDLDVNLRATRLMEGRLMPGDVIVGNCIVSGMDPSRGATLAVPDDFELPEGWFR